MENLASVVQTIIGFGALGIAFKATDWLISLKYMSKDECNKCRKEQAKEHTSDKERIVRIETKIDMLLGYKSVDNQ